MFRRKPRQHKFGPDTLKMKVAGARSYFNTEVLVRPLARGTPRVYVLMGTLGDFAVGFLDEDEVRRLSGALLDAIEQSKALTRESTDVHD